MKYAIIFILTFTCIGLHAESKKTTKEILEQACKCQRAFLYNNFVFAQEDFTCEGKLIYMNKKESQNSSGTEFTTEYNFVVPAQGEGNSYIMINNVPEWATLHALSYYDFGKFDMSLSSHYEHVYTTQDGSGTKVDIEISSGVPYIEGHLTETKKCHYDDWGARICDPVVETISNLRVERPGSFRSEQKWVNEKTKVNTKVSVDFEKYASCLQ